ncbi:uncharacterized protein BJ212DRAFT_1585471 [Suillus subaureus]|uniref:Uncharacterized protein n=1 Tax=Suillus subaureus TaxID=48587 RepID=A0A9P7EIG1_9AGAM|nr:uncharacterized protein BJ212DRAFT_1585471 [Suillus subaureus]KAG1822803.1 hypothetical protein BJ212DRAFT_1585471 [Suillus subaureus]
MIMMSIQKASWSRRGILKRTVVFLILQDWPASQANLNQPEPPKYYNAALHSIDKHSGASTTYESMLIESHRRLRNPRMPIGMSTRKTSADRLPVGNLTSPQLFFDAEKAGKYSPNGDCCASIAVPPSPSRWKTQRMSTGLKIEKLDPFQRKVTYSKT